MNYGPSPFPPGSLVWAYLRYSSEDQNLASQESYVRAWCEYHRLVLGLVFKDEAKSGTTTAGRDDFLRLIEFLERGPQPRPGGVVIWDLKRWSRNYDDSQFFKAKLRRLGYVLHSLNDNIPAGREGRIIESIRDWANEDEALKRRDDTRRGLHDLALRGYSTGGFPPVGYRPSERIEIGRKKNGEMRYAHKWEIDPETEGRVRLAWRMKLEGKSHWEIHAATRLCANARGYSYIFYRVTYAGAIKCGDAICWEAHPAYVTRAEWEQVQKQKRTRAERAADREHSPAREKRGNPFLLSGILRCGDCGWAMVGTSNGRERYYRCDWRHRQGYQQEKCKQPALVAHVIHTALREWLAEKIFTAAYLKAARVRVNEVLSGKSNALAERRDFLEKERRRLKQAIQNVVNAIEVGGFSPELQERLTQRRVELETTEVELSEVQLQMSGGKLTVSDEVLEYLAAHMQEVLAHEDAASLTQVRAVIKEIVKKGELHRERLVLYYTPLPFVEAVLRAPPRTAEMRAQGWVSGDAAYGVRTRGLSLERAAS